MPTAPDIDPEGYLLDPTQWTEAFARTSALQGGITLTDDHWAVIRFMRLYWEENQVAPNVRWTTKFVTETLGADRNRLYELFPYEYSQEACRIAGMLKPRAWTTG
jgi:tRNA 2-thiouridine synthesizing protein E